MTNGSGMKTNKNKYRTTGKCCLSKSLEAFIRLTGTKDNNYIYTKYKYN